MLQVLTLPAAERPFHLSWSWWRRAHQAVARRCHTARRARSPTAPPRTPVPPATPVVTTARLADGAAADFQLNDAQWARVAPLLPASTGRGRPARHQRQHLEGLRWLQQTGASWRSVPAAYGNWETLYSCYRLWQATGLWQRLLDRLARGDSEVSL